MFSKAALLLLFALFIDGLQALISLALLGVITGVSVVPVVGWVIGAGAQPVGLILGAAIDITLSITMGGALLVALALNGMFYWGKVIPAFFELIPGLNNGPTWTFIVLRCMWEHARRSKSTKEGVGILKASNERLPLAQRVMGLKAKVENLRTGKPTEAQQIPQSGKELVRTALTQRPAFDGIKPLTPRPTQPNVKTA